MTKSTEDVLKRVLSKHVRAIVHMRQQIEDDRFGLILGAGASIDFGFPLWGSLIRRIAAHSSIDATALLASAPNNTSQSQLLYQHFRAKHAVNATPTDHEFNRMEMTVRASWQRIVHECLYKDVPTQIADLKSKDKYLWAFLKVIKNTRLTINYNFDDTIERLLADSRANDEKETTRGYATVWNSNIQMYPRNGVIYHPNGFLPLRIQERPSEQLVFLEDTFADQLIDSIHGHYASLSYQLAQSTRLLMGLSLDDATLKHLLRQNAQLHSGHFHYHIAFVRDDQVIDAPSEQAITDSNFSVYNLVTLFLKAVEIAALGELLSMDDQEFKHLAEDCRVPIAYRFLVTGPVSVGKSSTASNFRCLRTVDEWLEPRMDGMEKDPGKLKPDELAEVDNWVARQLGLKNKKMLDTDFGVNIVDRAPLDAFAFTAANEWQNKAQKIREAITGTSDRKVCGAHVIFLKGDPEVMAVRSIARHKSVDTNRLKEEQKLLEHVYKDLNGVSVIDTRDKSISQVVREVSQIIYRNNYVEADLEGRLIELEKGVFNAP
jgi:hypothetical protein